MEACTHINTLGTQKHEMKEAIVDGIAGCQLATGHTLGLRDGLGLLDASYRIAFSNEAARYTLDAVGHGLSINAKVPTSRSNNEDQHLPLPATTSRRSTQSHRC